MSKAKNLLNEYLTELDRTAKTLSQLQERAETIRKARAARESVDEQIDALEQQTDELRDERERLKADYAAAMFEGSVSDQQRITRRRAAIDKELDRLRAEIVVHRESADVDQRVEVAEVRALLDSLKAPSYRELLEQLEPVLEQGKKEFNASLQAARNGLPNTYDTAHYKAVREQHDALYASQQASERYYAQKDRERRERLQRYGRGDSTDAVHASLGAPRKSQDGTMTVIESGRELSPYSLDH
ncbi:MAG: hypothetical protein M3Q29_14725 [Chloroflexota bacterium]|nr:hypothetical protein [Chloroflexota bacterium]